MPNLFQFLLRPSLGWAALAVAAGACVALAFFDNQLKHAPHTGFVLPGTTWSIKAEDFPLVWDQCRTLPEAEPVEAALREQIHDVALGVRLATGIRPTPSRWALWMGRKLVISGKGADWGGCVRPGLLMHGASWLARRFGTEAETARLQRFGPYYFTWKQGFLLFSTNASLLDKTDTISETWPDYSSPETVTWRNVSADASLSLSARGELLLSGTFGCALTSEGAPDALITPEWPKTSVGVLTLGSPRQLGPLADAIARMLGTAPVTSRFIAFLERPGGLLQSAPLPAGWEQGLSACSLILDRVDLEGNVPIPELTLALRALDAFDRHPWAAFTALEESVPYAWGDYPGHIVPIAGPGVSLCLAGRSPYWFVTSQEPLMKKALDAPLLEHAVAGEVHLSLNLDAFSAMGAAWLMRAAEFQILGELTPDTIDATVKALQEALSLLGRLDIAGAIGDGALDFTGRIIGSAGSAS